jgi:hypothetical protein
MARGSPVCSLLAMAVDPTSQRIHDTLTRVLLVSLEAPARGTAHAASLAQVRLTRTASCLLSHPTLSRCLRADTPVHSLPHPGAGCGGEASAVGHTDRCGRASSSCHSASGARRCCAKSVPIPARVRHGSRVAYANSSWGLSACFAYTQCDASPLVAGAIAAPRMRGAV